MFACTLVVLIVVVGRVVVLRAVILRVVVFLPSLVVAVWLPH